MAETKLKPAAKNPWYVLMTIYGEQTGDAIDSDLAARNRAAWNGWACQNLSDEETTALAQQMGLEVAESRAWRPDAAGKKSKLATDMRRRFSKRFGAKVALPDVAAVADLSGITFPNTVMLGKVIFTQDAWFDGATFTQTAWFHGATFTQDARFTGATFRQNALFHGATFTQTARFIGATFTQPAWFHGATFTQPAWFHGATFQGRSTFVGTKFAGVRSGDQKFTPSRAIFADCEFQRPVTFREAEFVDAYPDWTGAILHERIDLTAQDKVEVTEEIDGKSTKRELRYWPKLPKPTPEEAKNSRESCAVMRHALNKQGRPEEEHFFYRKEMEFALQSGRLWEVWKWLPYWLYDGVSGYGNSLWRPTFLLICLFLAGTVVNASYFGSVDFAQTGGTVDSNWVTGAGMSASNMVPGFALTRTYFDRQFLEKLDWPIKFVAGLQSILGVILLFFLGLGLRTRFRLR